MEDAKEKVGLSKLMEVIMMEISKIMQQMDMEYMLGRKDLGSKANGKIMFQMGMEKQLIRMAPGMLGSF